jgi:hypothetical protein
MGLFLKERGKGKEVWTEAEDALAGFEEWRKSLRLDQLEGEVGAIGRMLDETEAIRRQEAGMQQIVFDGPQVSHPFPPLFVPNYFLAYSILV